tara:strand:+ start:94 stop:267 length:174 start_codon:yes stop_codon:yes gene_type:complete
MVHYRGYYIQRQLANQMFDDITLSIISNAHALGMDLKELPLRPNTFLNGPEGLPGNF